MDKLAKYFHVTVPHSGTRYVNVAVQKAAGIKHIVSPVPHRWHRGQRSKLLFVHFAPNYREMIEWGYENAEKTWVTVRSPIHTWGTYWHDVAPTLPNEYYWKERLGMLRLHYQLQDEFLSDHPEIPVFRVEDGLGPVSEYLGLELKEHEQTFSRPSPMKDAIMAQDLEKMAELSGRTDFLKGFREGITPEIRGLYQDKLGYDFWWE